MGLGHAQRCRCARYAQCLRRIRLRRHFAGGDYTTHVVIGVDPENRMYLLDLWRGQQRFGNVRFGALCGLKSDVALLRTENRRRGRVRICRSFGWPAHPTLGRMFARANLHLALVAVMCCPTVHLSRNTQIGIR
jgi:hypothetical protein